jgi:hypothetical protein
LLKPANDNERLEKFKLKLTILNTITDKFIIAVIIAICGYFLNRSIERYKSDLQTQLQLQRESHERAIEQLRLANSNAIAAANSAQEAKLEQFRTAQMQELEKLRAVLILQSSLSERTTSAYETVLNACEDLIDHLARSFDATTNAAGQRRDAILRFQNIYRKNRLYLNDATTTEFDHLVYEMGPQGIMEGDRERITKFYDNADRATKHLRRQLRAEIEKQRQALK